MWRFTFSCLLLTLAACTGNSNSGADKEAVVTADTGKQTETKESNYVHRFGDTVLEKKITEALLKLPFVQKSDSYIDSISNHKHGISFLLDTAAGNTVSVQAGYNGEQRFETYYHFYVDPKTMEIKVYDPVEDKTLTIKEYVKTLK